MTTRTSYKKTLLAAAIAATLATGAGMPTSVRAQTAEATLRGHAAPNTEVVAKNVATGVTRRTIAGADGSYALPGLQPGKYTVTAGPGTEAAVILTVDSTATLDLVGPTAEAAAPVGEITVRAQRLVDVRTSEVGGTVSLHQIETVPQITRNFLEFADTVPGLVFAVNDQGQTSLKSGGQNASAVNVYIDGVGQKNYVKEGGVSGQFATQGNPFPQLAIGEYKVITSNYKAEFDQVSSAAVTAGTKSGTNEFHGEAYGQYTSDKFRAETPAEVSRAIKQPSKDKEFGVAVGGPILQDRMHFFFAYEGKRYDTPVAVTPGVTTLNGAPISNFLPASVNSQFGPAALPFDENLYFGKLDFEPTDYDRIELSVKVRNESQIKNIGIASAQSASITNKNDETRYDLRWQHSADRWLNEFLITYEDAFDRPSATNIGNGAQYLVQSQGERQILATGAADPRATQNKGQRGPGVQDDLTFSNLQWLGDHTVKGGVKVKRIDLTAADALNINPQFSYNVTPAGTDTVPYKALFTNPVAGLSPTAQSRDWQYGIYIQDDWVQNEHLTWNLGVRWDIERNLGFLDYVTPPAVAAAFNAQDPNAPAGQTYAQSLAKGGVNVNDYISTGHNRKAYTSEFQPRLGFSVDLNADQRHVVFGGYGRSYDRDLYDYLQVEVTKAALPEYTVFFKNPGATAPNGCFGNPCFAFDPKYMNGIQNLQALVGSSSAGAEVDAVNNNLKVPYSDQFSLGIRNRVGDWNTSATVARILSKDGFVFTLGNRYPNGAFFMNGGQPWGNGVPGFGSLIIGNNGIETKTTQLLLFAEKPFTQESHWSATFAYTYTDSSANRSTTEHYAFDEETIRQYPFINSNAAARHRIVSTGSYGAPWGFVMAAKLTLATPIPINDVACYGVTYATGSGCTPISVTPKNFFGYRALDLQVTKNFEIANYATVYLRLDGLNVFNYQNYSDTILNFGSNGKANPNPVVYNYQGNINGVPRTLKLTVGAKF
jgi:outer membrane receptor protein involved in Fe transport